MTFFRRQGLSRYLLSVILIISLLLSITPPVYADDRLGEIRSILNAVYVDPVPDDVLTAPNLEETLKRLGDPHTQYFSPQEYREFISSIDNTFSGIGIYLDSVPEGILVTGVVPDSPAEASGFTKGDIITHADGKPLAGKAIEYAQSLIKGEEGTSVRLTVKRDSKTTDIDVVRKRIEIPTVTGEVLEGHIGYLALNSFGSDTSSEFEKTVKRLQTQGVDSWIVDLRNNPGGYMGTALDIAGFFIGERVALQTQDRSEAREPYDAYRHAFVIDEPMIFLVNEWSASASEILASAIKDYSKALIIGTNTYGKGTVQSIYELSDGGALKVTTSRFYSALGKSINGTGVKPDLTISDNPLEVAVLLLSQVGHKESPVTQRHMLKTASGNFQLDAQTLQKPEHWVAAHALMGSVKNNPGVQLFQDSANGWIEVGAVQLAEPWSLFYRGYKQVTRLEDVSLDKKFTVKFSAPYEPESVNESSIELIEALTGERLGLTFNNLPGNSLEIVPKSLLKPEETYYLVIHNTILDANGHPLKEGAVAIVETGNETSTETKEEAGTKKSMQAWKKPSESEVPLASK